MINNFDSKILMRRRVTYSSDGKRDGREPAKRCERWSALTDGFSSLMDDHMTHALQSPSVRRDRYPLATTRPYDCLLTFVISLLLLFTRLFHVRCALASHPSAANN